ncbi:DUF7379 domain-containing protein [Paucibacter soli]|uniref:DUF7379 domain-containing protein n=1 Tax=Paucibacter soli TaxID=3133433 RepID=UPI0030A2F464
MASIPTPAPATIALRVASEGLTPTTLLTSQVRISGTPRRVRPLSASRDAGLAASTLNVQSDEVVRVEYENGLVMWLRADDLLRERGRKSAQRGDGGAAWELDASARIGACRDDIQPSGERGLLSLGIKALDFIGIDLAGASARSIGLAFERRQLGNEPGLYRVALAPQLAMSALADGSSSIRSDQPVLLFLHGTMSSFAGSYAALAATSTTAAADESGHAAAALRQQIAQRYGQEVYAWEHRTLSESPIRNALELVKQLPVGAQLHLVSHSRGGLVGELLTLGQRARADDPLNSALLDRLFAQDGTAAEQLGLGALLGEAAQLRSGGYQEDSRLLAELLALLDERRIRVLRFARVACPARGTTLASGRLDRWLSVLDAVLGRVVPGGLFGDAMDFLLAVVKERTDPRTLPGLEAMMPGSALTRLLHTPGLTTSADLSVIAGDIEGRGLLGQLKLLALDWFYAADHDLVVNTSSMLGGIARPAGGARYRRDQGEQVSHFNYFRNKLSIDWLAAALARQDGSDAGFLPIAETTEKPAAPSWWKAVSASRAASTPRPIAIVVPGTMGSALKSRGDPIWLEYWPLLKGGLGEIGIEAGDVEAVDLLGDFYGPLLEHLTRSHRVEILPYDWRLSVREAAQRLAAKLEAVLPDAERSHQPVHIVAHSMGGLVARAMIADGGAGAAAWRRLCALPASRLLMLGTPNRGSHEAVRWLTGHNPTQAKLILLDLTRGADGVIDIVRRFPGLAELLPWDQEPNPWAQAATWKALRKELNASWTPIEDGVLRQAAATWKLLRDAAIDPEHMIYVAGCQSATVVGHEIEDEAWGFGRKKLRWIASSEGDGTVPWASGRLKDVRTFYAPDTGHDQLCSNADDRSIFRGYVDLLLSGTTDQLPSTPPARARGAGAEAERFFTLPELPVFDELPDAAALRGLGFGGTRARRRAAGALPQSARLRVSLRHGDLRYARHPVLVGHYQDDTIVNAEASLDQRLRGRQALGPLTRKRELGLYPGAAGSHAVFFNEIAARSPSGALVVGLGQVGELSPGRLEAGVRDLLLDYALQLLQRDALARQGAPRDRERDGRLSASLSSLLVGTGAASLSAQESMEAVLRGALAANRKLEDARLDQQVLIDGVEFVELYQDLAIGAARDLARLLASADLGPKLNWPCAVVEPGEGGLQRSRFDADQSWWQRIEITEDRKADRLRFVVTGDRARAEAILAFGQLRLADGFIAQACGSAGNNSEVSKTLFEMLLPNRLKESAPDQRAMVLLLDEASARFPWELLEDRWSHLGRPPAVVSGMVRQLKTEQFRAQPNHAFQNSVFVVGNPDLEGWDGFADLPGARQEAEQVRLLFAQSGYDVTASIDAQAASILTGLHSKPLRVLHLAGHGEHEFEFQGRKCSGMVIGKGIFLTPGDVEQMRYVPELVFVNCCKLGKTGGTLGGQNLLAANLGVGFIRMGVRAVICAGWAVDDAAALTFAKTFYGAMLVGKTFGQAVLEARRAAWERHPGANTWGAYQCYGDPGYRLVREDGEAERAAKPPLCSAAELVIELRNRAEDTRMQSKEKDCDETALQAQLRARIDALLKRMPTRAQPECQGEEDWLARADVCAALGFAYGEAKLFEEALVWLDKALASEQGECPVRAAEQATNYRVSLAALEWVALRQRAGTAQAPELAGQRHALAARIEQALRELDVINARASTSERLRLMGSACQRLAWVQSERARSEALLNMAAYYRQAFDAKPDAYAFCNWAVACLLLESIDPAYARGDWHAALDTQCEQQASAARAQQEASPSFWGECALGHLAVVQLLLAARDAERCAALARAATAHYEAALARGASLREAATIQEHLDFLIELTGERRAPWDLAVHEALQTMRRAV